MESAASNVNERIVSGILTVRRLRQVSVAGGKWRKIDHCGGAVGLEALEWIEQAARDRHPRLQGVVPPVLQTLLWWQFDVRR